MLVLHNVVPYHKGLKNKQQDSPRKIGKTALQSQTYRHTGAGQKRSYRGFLHSQINSYIENQQNIKHRFSGGAGKLDHSGIYPGFFQRFPDDFDDPPDHFPSNEKNKNRQDHFQSEADDRRKLIGKIVFDVQNFFQVFFDAVDSHFGKLCVHLIYGFFYRTCVHKIPPFCSP